MTARQQRTLWMAKTILVANFICACNHSERHSSSRPVATALGSSPHQQVTQPALSAVEFAGKHGGFDPKKPLR